MRPISIHQAIHGYRDGHRLLSSSVTLSTESARAMLTLSDMSGQTMQQGFETYLTGYPLPGSEFFILAKTWNAPEMERPGCVWTHSLLLSREQVAGSIGSARLMTLFSRPAAEAVDSSTLAPLVLEMPVEDKSMGALKNPQLAAGIVELVISQEKPVMVTVDQPDQIEEAFLRLWDVLWPAARSRFSFCTGSLMPRSIGGSLMDLQAVPSLIPSAQFRKSANTATLADVRNNWHSEPWLDFLLTGGLDRFGRLSSWFDTHAGANAWPVVRRLAPLFGLLHVGSPARALLASFLPVDHLPPTLRCSLIRGIFAQAQHEAGPRARRELLQDLSIAEVPALAEVAETIVQEMRDLFVDGRTEAIALVHMLLSSALTEVGEEMLRTAVPLLCPEDIESFTSDQAGCLSTIVGASHRLAEIPEVWRRIGNRSGEVLNKLSEQGLDAEVSSRIIDAIMISKCEVSVDKLVHFGGRQAIFRGLSAIAGGHTQLSWPWRQALGRHRDDVLMWLESLPSPALSDLQLGSQFVSPKYTQQRLHIVWKAGVANANSVPPRIAAFGLSLAWSLGDVQSPLLAACFQSTYDAAKDSQLEHEEWEWIREFAPPAFYWKDWDKCERLALAMARLFERNWTPLLTISGIIRSQHAIRQFAMALHDNRDFKPYLKWLQTEAKALNESELFRNEL